MKSRLSVIVVALVLVFGAVGFVHYGPPRFWGDFSGMTEAEARARLGEPFRDSRNDGVMDSKDFTLGWPRGLEQGFFLKFKDGVVVSQERYSR